MELHYCFSINQIYLKILSKTRSINLTHQTRKTCAIFSPTNNMNPIPIFATKRPYNVRDSSENPLLRTKRNKSLARDIGG